MKHIIIGTAGHIDHGKTTLIKAMTGVDTDRLAEEKRRGITIELGFTYFMLPSGEKAGIVDVPGHEKFINNMAAGVVGMDIVLLVIAADEGIMPQTREHIDILRMLGIEKLIIVLNKVDLVETDWLEMVEEEIKVELEDTIFNQAPIARVSARTGEGMENLIHLIDQIVREEIEPKNMYTISRLPIDRVFSVEGFGTIVTGTLITGRITKDETLTLYPTEKECRVRNIQVHGENVEQCCAGQRVAVNLPNIKKEEIKRGCVLASSGSMKNTKLLDVKLQVLESSGRILKNNTRLHLYIGTDEVLCRAILLDAEEVRPGECGYVQLRLEKEIAVRRNDKFIIRFYSPVETIGGGIILESNPRKKKRFNDEAILELLQKENGNPTDILEIRIKEYGESAVTISELEKLTGCSKTEILEDVEHLDKQGAIVCFALKKETYIWHMEVFEAAKEKVFCKLKLYEKEYPYRWGMKKAELHTLCFTQLSQNIFDKLIEIMVETDFLKRQNNLVALCGHQIKRDKKFDRVEKTYIDVLGNARYGFLKISEINIEGITDIELEDIRNVLEAEDRIIKVSDEVYTIKSYIDEAEKRIRDYFEVNEILTIVQVKEMFGISRKNAKLLIEFMDREKVTRKNGAETERVAY